MNAVLSRTVFFKSMDQQRLIVELQGRGMRAAGIGLSSVLSVLSVSVMVVMLSYGFGLACASEVSTSKPPSVGTDEVAPAGPPLAEVLPPPPPPDYWSGGVELGLNGTDGNSENFKIRMAGNAKRDTPANLFTTDWRYAFATADGIRTENRFLINARDELRFPESRWNLFVSSLADVDEFRDYDWRLAVHSGVGYQWLKTETLLVKSRAGAGGSREFGGPNDRFAPELQLGGDLEWTLSQRQKFTSTVDVYPSLDDFSDYWSIVKVNYEVLVDPTWNLTLKLGALNRYDSTPANRKRNDIEYFAVLLWNF